MEDVWVVLVVLGAGGRHFMLPPAPPQAQRQGRQARRQGRQARRPEEGKEEKGEPTQNDPFWGFGVWGYGGLGPEACLGSPTSSCI